MDAAPDDDSGGAKMLDERCGVGTPPRGGTVPSSSEASRALGSPRDGEPSPGTGATVSTPDVAAPQVLDAASKEIGDKEEYCCAPDESEVPLISTPASTPVPAPGIPSVGSAGHSSGNCKPCAFLHTKGCQIGWGCKFCHLCEPGERTRRRKGKKEKMQHRRAAQRARLVAAEGDEAEAGPSAAGAEGGASPSESSDEE